MPRLILLNGPPGSGKSTLAERYAAEHPLTACLDVDCVRAMIGGWQSRRTEAGLQARAMVLAMARTHLTAGHDVIVPQFLAKADFVLQLEITARGYAVEFVELALLDGVDAAWTRFAARTAAAVHPAHVDAGSEIGDRAGFVAIHQQLQAMLAHRPAARIITTHEGDVDAAYAALLAALSQ